MSQKEKQSIVLNEFHFLLTFNENFDFLLHIFIQIYETTEIKIYFYFEKKKFIIYLKNFSNLIVEKLILKHESNIFVSL